MAQKKQQKELIALAVLVLVAGSIWYFHVGRSTTPSKGTSASHYSPINALDYVVIINGLAKAQGTEYKSAGRNIFVMGALPVETAKQGPPKKVFVVYSQPQPPEPPKPPVLPIVFFGYGMLPAGGARQAFLKDQQGDEVHIVSEGDVVLNHFRILHIGNDKIEYEDTLTGLKNSNNLEVPPSA